MTIEAQCRNFKFWLNISLTKNENKLSQIAYNDVKWNENKAFWSKKIKSLLEQIGLRRILDESTVCEHWNRKHDQAMT